LRGRVCGFWAFFGTWVPSRDGHNVIKRFWVCDKKWRKGMVGLAVVLGRA